MELPDKVIADFSKNADYPLVKTKFDVYNCTYVSYEHWVRDMHLTRELNIDGLRYDPGWGWGERGAFNAPYEFGGEQIGGSPERPIYNFSVMDEAAHELQKNDLKTMYVCAYTPNMLQDDRKSWQGKPKDLEAFGNICEDYARHWKSSRRAHYFEIWNEPDLKDVFFIDELEDYLEIYKHAAPGVRRGDPDALVGGPSLAHSDWMPSFLEYVKANRLPLDFISYHYYGDISQKVEEMRKCLSGDPSFAAVQTLITEYNSYRTGHAEFSMGGGIETHEAAMRILKDFKWFLEQPDLTKIYWAQYSDPEVFFDKYVDRCGIITTDGHRKASFNAFRIYGDMPVERKRLVCAVPGVDGMASADSRRAALVLWNETDEEKEIAVEFQGVSFPRGNFKLYRIDKEHASFLDNSDSERLEAAEYKTNVDTARFSWSGTIPARAVVYLTLEDGSFLAEDAPKHIADEIQTLYYYPDRTKKNYAEFDRKTWTAFLGMAEHDEAFSAAAVIAERLPGELDAEMVVDGDVQVRDQNSILGIQVDYFLEGEYAKSVLFHAGVYHADRSEVLPWGTKRLPDEVVDAGSRFVIPVKAHAPAGWDGGRCIITFMMQNTGARTRVKIRLNPAEGKLLSRLAAYDAVDCTSAAIPDKTGNGFDGIPQDGNAYADLPVPLTDDFSVSFWFRTAESGKAGAWYAGNPLICARCDELKDGFGVVLSGNRIAFGVGTETVRSASNVNDGKWRHCAVTRDGSTGRIALYLNGRLEAVSEAASGKLPAIAGLAAKDRLEDVQIFNYVLRQGEIDECSGERYRAAEFRFAETAGSTLVDSSAYGKNGTLYGGAVRGSGEPGHTVRFNGLDAYGVIKRNVSDDFTIMFWLKTDDAGGEGAWYNGKGIIDGRRVGAANDFGISLVGGKLAFGTGPDGFTIRSASDVNDGKWHHCAVTRRRSDGRIRIYVDGKPEAEAHGSKNSLFSGYELSIGRIHDGTNYLRGEIGCLRMYGESLSSRIIMSHANRER